MLVQSHNINVLRSVCVDMPEPSVDLSLRLVSPSFDSPLTDTLMELNHLRRLKLGGSTVPWLFFQLKQIFHILESVGSARIEGNRTTISEYIEQKIEKKERSTERYSEIANVEGAMTFIEENISQGAPITHHFIRQLHSLVVEGLSEEGDKTPGAYRAWDVQITGSEHTPPGHLNVQQYMEELLAFINAADAEKYDLLKTAIAHHRFTWVHPFGNGNGRVVRLLTYALLIKYGFNVKKGKILNPTAVFCSDRDVYYEMLSKADVGGDEELLAWCQYALAGVLDEVAKVNKLLDFEYLLESVLQPTIELARERENITSLEFKVLSVAIKKQIFKASDLKSAFAGQTVRQRTHQISKMKEMGLICPLEENARTYYPGFTNNLLIRSLMVVLEREGFTPSLDK